jgi:hypothetical protein
MIVGSEKRRDAVPAHTAARLEHTYAKRNQPVPLSQPLLTLLISPCGTIGLYAGKRWQRMRNHVSHVTSIPWILAPNWVLGLS